MIISKTTAKRLIKSGKAAEVGTTYHDGNTYMVINRSDVQRTDHYLIGSGDLR